jgi:diguanylate cyclase (GGDEF)-like protein
LESFLRRDVVLVQLHENVIEEVLVEASRGVEIRIAQFRAFLALLLAVFGAQNFFWAGTVMKGPFLPLSLTSCTLALLFSLFVLMSQTRVKNLKVTTLAIASIGIDACLVVLPVSLFFSEGTDSSGAMLNQPSVFAMYLLVIASGLRFREVARLGIAVNGCVIFSLMVIEAVRSRTPEGLAPIALLAIRQHFLLLASSALLAWLISTHIRTTTLMAAQTAQQATVDGLTGVYNRHHLRQRLDQLSRDEKRGFHLLMADVDHFKQINDKLGHLMGDRVLIEVARRLQGALRPGDLLARYGGEEFCVVLTRLDDSLAEKVGERLRSEMARIPIEGLSVTTSVGVSRWDGKESMAALLDRADRALYQAKQQGRNRVAALWPELSSDPPVPAEAAPG